MRKASTSRTATGPTPGESGFQRSEGGPGRRGREPGTVGVSAIGTAAVLCLRKVGVAFDSTALTTTWVVRGEASLGVGLTKASPSTRAIESAGLSATPAVRAGHGFQPGGAVLP